MSVHLIIDCGTTNLRVTMVDSKSFSVLGTQSAAGGVRHTAIDGHNGRLRTMLRECVEGVLAAGAKTVAQVERCVAYGMITSNMGLCEIAHLPAPASAEDFRNGIRRVCFDDIAPFEIEFIPGLKNFSGEVNWDNCSGMDMMRGEEVESIGLYELLAQKEETLLVLPGSHNKFVHMSEDGRILGCMTSISGELLDAVTHHTILAGSVESSFCTASSYCSELAIAGAKECARSGLGRAAFTGRIMNTLGGSAPSAIQSYLLGVVLAEDVRAMRAFIGEKRSVRICIAGKPPVQQAVYDVLWAMGETGAMQVSPEVSRGMGLAGVKKIAF